MCCSLDKVNFHKYLFSGLADFIVTNTKTGNRLHYHFLSCDSYGTEFALSCLAENSNESVGYIGKFYFEEKSKIEEPIKFRQDKFDRDLENCLAYKSFIYLLKHRQLPDIVTVEPLTCGYCGCLLGEDEKRQGFCAKHTDTKENLFDAISFMF